MRARTRVLLLAARNRTVQVTLTFQKIEVDHLLNSTCPVHVQGDLNQILCNAFANDVSLLVRGVLQQLLAQVVAKWIYRHKVD